MSMTRANARELAVHLIYAREFTGEEPQSVISARLERDYYRNLAKENEIYNDAPSPAQRQYLDTVVTGVANREEELNAAISRFSIGWDIRRISRLTRCIMQLAMFETLYMESLVPLRGLSRLTEKSHVSSDWNRYQQLYHIHRHV